MTEFDDMKEDVIMNEAAICAAATGGPTGACMQQRETQVFPIVSRSEWKDR